VQDVTGASDFDSLNSAMRWRPESIILYAFDLMHLDGKNLRQRHSRIGGFAQKR
jgi:ATP-dependent DNA ligase